METFVVTQVIGPWRKAKSARVRGQSCAQCDGQARAEREVWTRTPFVTSGVMHGYEFICIDCLAAGRFEPLQPIDATKEHRA